MSSIRSHKTLGVNAKLAKVHCPVCGQVKDDGLVLLGSKNYKVQCSECKTWNIGGMNYKDRLYTCCNPACGYQHTFQPEKIELGKYENIESNGVCQECEDFMKQGIILISVKDGEESENPYRTGGWAVVKEEAVRKMIPDQTLCEQICKKRICFVPDEVWNMVGLPAHNQAQILSEAE